MTSRPSILYVTTVPDFLRAFLVPHAEHFRSLGWRVAAATSGVDTGGRILHDRSWDPQTEAAFPERYDLGLRRGTRGGFGLAGAVGRLRKVLRDGRFDIVHAHTPVAGVATRLAARRFRASHGLSVVYTAHGFHFHPGRSPAGNLVWEWIERRCAALTDWLVVLNQADYGVAAGWTEIPTERVTLMPGIGLDTSIYRPKGRGAHDRGAYSDLGIREDQRIVLMLAELRPNKRVQDAIRALAQIPDPAVVLCVAGHGTSRGPLERLAGRIGVRERVRFLGYRRDVPSLLRGADALVLCSEREGLPRSILEAMATGVPVVASDVRGNRDLLATGAGLLYRVGDVAALASRLAEVLTDRDLGERLAREGRRAVARYELREVLALHELMYDRAILARSRGTGPTRPGPGG